LTAALNRLRSAANWSYLVRSHTRVREAVTTQIARYVEHAQPGSLAVLLAQGPTDDADPARCRGLPL
jgi:hypothetical protein